jgi:hypothetical protein
MMDGLGEAPWRILPSALIMATGLAAFVYGVESLARALRISIWDLHRPIVWVAGFRAAIIGLAVAALGAAWLTQQLWVLLLALAIGGEELLETSIILFALRRGRRIDHAPAAE